MPIAFDSKRKIFNLLTPNSSYIFGIFGGKIPLHIHYGKRTDGVDGAMMYTAVGDISAVNEGFLPEFLNEVSFDRCPYGGGDFEYTPEFSTDAALCEYPTYGNNDLRTPAFHAVYKDGSRITNFEYVSHSIKAGKPKLEGLPATYTENDSEADTLTVLLRDSLTGLEARLYYTVYNDFDAITRSVRFSNRGSDDIRILGAMSASVDFNNANYDFVHLQGGWARERHIERVPLSHGSTSIGSKRCMTSHETNPFIAVAAKNACEDYGEVYGFNLVYSGNFIAKAEVERHNYTRVLMGINPFDFGWMLKPNDNFQTPETVMVFSANGFGDMSRTYHKLYRTRLCRGKYRDARRPVLINNWEATYFNFTEDKILGIAKQAKELGMELFVLDDGWFGRRNSDNCSLGDWYPNKEKLPSGISGIADKINAIGLKFGLWFEPEMISPDSDLYREHHDWCIHVNNRTRNTGRRQLVLDLSRKDVCDYIKNFLTDILSSANISYVKWDMNRCMTDLGSDFLSAECQQELAHRYVLGLYDIMETVTSAFPDILFEGCAGGGGRFDAGILYYMPQIWASDDTDAIERLKIQYGTSMVYPFCTMGCHVSAVPNHQCGRVTPYMTRFNAAMPGQFGYELDLGLLNDEEKKMTKKQVSEYIENAEFIHSAELYRLSSPFESNITALEFLSEDNAKAMLFVYTSLTRANDVPSFIRLKNLDGRKLYKCSNGNTYNGSVLMNIGIPVQFGADFESYRFTFEQL